MKAACAAILLALPLAATAAGDSLTTVAERSKYRVTGRYSEVLQLCGDFEKAYPRFVRCVTFGRSPEGRAMVALVVSRAGTLLPDEARRKKLPVVLIQGGIHAGEIDGKDAGFLALREMLEGRAARGALDKTVLIFVPVFNVDGHERFGRYNRPNQRGPEEMGWRTTSQNFNLNRDYVKSDSPEMQSMLRLVDTWDPLATIDLHVTDGAKFQHDIAILVEPVHAGDEALRKAGKELRDGVIDDLSRQGSLPLAFYPSFVVTDDPASGFVDNVAPPRLSHGYFYLRNRIGMLVETHSWKDYSTRVRATRNTIVSVMSRIADAGAAWLAIASEADKRAASLAGNSLPLTYKATDSTRTISFKGYEYTRTPSDISGALATRYNEYKPQIWRLPLRDEIRPDLVVSLPKAGYIVPAPYAAIVGEKLSLHGIAFRNIAASLRAPMEAFRATKVTLSPASNEGHQTMTFEGRWAVEPRDIAAGALYVPSSQSKARLVAALLEPQAPDSLAYWGWFATAFEKKEYMEDYVAEDIGRHVVATDPKVAAEFRKRIETDPEFAKSKKERLDFFYRRHPSWDERYNLYPVLRADVEPR